jgi:hypothetical protein
MSALESIKNCDACNEPAFARVRVRIEPMPIHKRQVTVHETEALLCINHLADPGPLLGWTYTGDGFIDNTVMQDSQVSLQPCQCEHIAHAGQQDTPNGNPGHTYRVRFNRNLMVWVTTEYGDYLICPDCRTDCHRLSVLT